MKTDVWNCKTRRPTIYIVLPTNVRVTNNDEIERSPLYSFHGRLSINVYFSTPGTPDSASTHQIPPALRGKERERERGKKRILSAIDEFPSIYTLRDALCASRPLPLLYLWSGRYIAPRERERTGVGRDDNPQKVESACVGRKVRSTRSNSDEWIAAIRGLDYRDRERERTVASFQCANLYWSSSAVATICGLDDVVISVIDRDGNVWTRPGYYST